MTREERNAVRKLAADNKSDWPLAVAKHLGLEAEYKAAVRDYKGRGDIPDGFAASFGSIIDECKAYETADAEESKAKAAK